MTRICPRYRLRLFLSVDLVGSTAFKNNFGEIDNETANPIWVNYIHKFYSDFPKQLSVEFDSFCAAKAVGEYKVPAVWKLIGDEIIFCCKLIDLEHLSICIKVFLKTLKTYGAHLEKAEIKNKKAKLDVKGCGWIAAFPAPNVTVRSSIFLGSYDKNNIAYDLLDEAIEQAADTRPSEYDFLGKSIDSGFRIGRYCAADEMSLSLELAYLISKAADNKFIEGVDFSYAGRESLKGVINDLPYPLVTIGTERNQARIEVRKREKVMQGNGHLMDAMSVHDFLRSFMSAEGLELPILKSAKDDIDDGIVPESYIEFENIWLNVNTEIENRAKVELESEVEDTASDSDGSLPSFVDSEGEKFAKAAAEET